jgi:hypothetical protein
MIWIYEKISMFEKYVKMHSFSTLFGGKRMQNASIYTSYTQF